MSTPGAGARPGLSVGGTMPEFAARADGAGILIGMDRGAIRVGLYGFTVVGIAIASLFIPWGLPALTLPFCFGTLAFALLKGASTKLEPVAVEDITTPEEHLARARTAAQEEGVGRVAVPA